MSSKEKLYSYDIVKIAKRHYKNYGEYVNNKKMFPSAIDGLLPVHRRLLTTLNLIASKEYVKTAKVIGDCMGRFHPHQMDEGPVSYLVSNGFADGSGSWGCNIGSVKIECAAMRYTKVKQDDFIGKIAFKYIKDVKWVENDADPEPENIPTMFPFCLFGNKELSSIGFGFKTDIPTYNISDLYMRLKWLLNKEKKEPIIYPKIEGCDILSSKETIKKLLTEGKGNIDIKGKYSIDEKNNCIYLYGWSPRVNFNSMFDKIDSVSGGLITNGDIIFSDLSTEKTGTKIMFQVDRKRNVNALLKQFSKALDEVLVKSIRYEIWAVKDNKSTMTSVDSMLLNAYEYYTQALNNNLESRKKAIEEKIYDMNIIEKIRKHIPIILSKNLSFKDSVEYLNTQTKESKEDISRILSNYNIRNLISVKLDINKLKTEITDITNKIKNIDATCWKEYESEF